MKITNLKTENYKSITDPLEITEFSNFNILVGPNNAGKTNILDSLELFFSPDNDSLKRKGASVHLEIKKRDETVTFVYKDGQLAGDISGEEYVKLTERVIRINEFLPIDKIATKKLKSFKKNHFKRYKIFSKTLEEYFQDIHISEELFKANVLTEEGKKPLKRMGEGFKRLFVMLFYIYNPAYDIILIDEPELHLHPSVIKKFLKIISGEKLSNQVLMTTHHPTFVQAKFLDKIWRVARNENHSTSVYKMGKGKIKAERFVQEINDDNSAMLFADKVLLVEGVSDSILMRGLIDKFYEESKDIKVVYSGGVGDIDLYEKVCSVFNIPYIAMMDEDGLESFWNKKFDPNSKKGVEEKKKLLKEKGIFVLNNSLEENYPKKYQNKETKPLNALSAATQIKKEDFESSKMAALKEVIENL